MKAKVTRGSGFRGALNYILDQGPDATGNKKPEIVGGNVEAGDAKEMSKQFAITRLLRTDVKKPVWHCSLSLIAGERLSSEEWSEIAADFMKEMQFDEDTLYTAVRHSDTDKDHIHIVASRVSLSGKIWHGKHEAFNAITATQTLEKRHNLTLTPGLGAADNEKRKARTKLSIEELSKAERTGIRPARDVIADAIESALQSTETQSLTDFIKRLEAQNVFVIPKISSQKRDLQGLSFEYDNLVFAGSKIATNSAYALSKLKKRGVEYEQTRDSEAINHCIRLAAERAERNSAAAADAAEHDIDSERDARTAAIDSDRVSSSGNASARDRQDADSATRSVQRSASSNEHENRESRRSFEARAERTEQREREERRSESAAAEQNTVSKASDSAAAEQNTTVSKASDSKATERVASEENRGEKMAISVSNSSSSRSSVSDSRSSSNKLQRFKQASAAKRAATSNDTATRESRRFSATEINDAKMIDPTPHLEDAGYVVKKEGRHLSVRTKSGDEAYRITRKSDGHYVACDRYANSVGDNIALLMHLHDDQFIDALFRLRGGKTLKNVVQKPVFDVENSPPRLPAQTSRAVSEGRDYLKNRGISKQTILEAERQKMLLYVSDGVIFAGYDKNKVLRSATRRATKASDEVQKRDFKGTDKTYPPLLRSGGSREVWIVEGGTDALAVLDRAQRAGTEKPFVIVSGGVNVRSFLKNAEVQEILKNATHITVVKENEKDAETQQKTQLALEKQVAEIRTLNANVSVFEVHAHSKDLAELNVYEQKQAEALKAQAEQQQQDAQARRNAYLAAKAGDDLDAYEHKKTTFAREKQ